MRKILLLGAGNDRRKKVYVPPVTADWNGELVTLDMNPNCGADVVWDLDWITQNQMSLPFKDEEFDELAAYDVLEHIGRQGNWRGFFDEFSEYWRILKPEGTFGIIVPIGDDALADPGHTRFFSATQFGFLSQDFYEGNLGAGAAVTDYRWYWKHNFVIDFHDEIDGHHLGVILRKTA